VRLVVRNAAVHAVVAAADVGVGAPRVRTRAQALRVLRGKRLITVRTRHVNSVRAGAQTIAREQPMRPLPQPVKRNVFITLPKRRKLRLALNLLAIRQVNKCARNLSRLMSPNHRKVLPSSLSVPS